jgi:hypothetical protein
MIPGVAAAEMAPKLPRSSVRQGNVTRLTQNEPSTLSVPELKALLTVLITRTIPWLLGDFLYRKTLVLWYACLDTQNAASSGV